MTGKLTPEQIEEFLHTAERSRSAKGRGKTAETEFREHLKRLKAQHPNFDFQRLYDAHSAGGRFQSQIADFLVFRKDPATGAAKHGVVEVKKIQRGQRLPAKNFPQKKFPPLERRQDAGAEVLILIYQQNLGGWRVAPLSYFTSDRGASSWDLTPFPKYDTLAEAAPLEVLLP